jgi:hypothetical protein
LEFDCFFLDIIDPGNVSGDFKSCSCAVNCKTTRPCRREIQELLGLQATLRTSEK